MIRKRPGLIAQLIRESNHKDMETGRPCDSKFPLYDGILILTGLPYGIEGLGTSIAGIRDCYG